MFDVSNTLTAGWTTDGWHEVEYHGGWVQMVGAQDRESRHAHQPVWSVDCGQRCVDFNFSVISPHITEESLR
jgi:hypothetical protein